VGIFVGIGEALLLLFVQHPAIFSEHAVGPAILFIAPLADMLAFGFLGGILGLVVEFGSRNDPRTASGLATAGVFIIATYATFLPARVWCTRGDHWKLAVMGIALLGGLIVTAIVRKAGPPLLRKPATGNGLFRSGGRALLRGGAKVLGAVLLGWVVIRMILPSPDSPQKERAGPAAHGLPNFVVISLDTARADHFSGYGYPRPTTPHLDNFAQRGVLFETAVAPGSWTLPSFATVFTGLLPHQHSADEHTPLARGFATMASILRARGYQTAGFNANFTMGTARTGLAQGFDTYNDDDASLSADWASISSVKVFWWLFYYPFIQPDSLVRRDARELNRPVFHWFSRRSERPFFLFVNYFDAHEPYHVIRGVGGQFGDANKTLAQRIRAEIDDSQMGIDTPQSPAQQAALIAGYDSTLAWADRQAGELLRLLEASPEWSNTYVIFFSDHGQAFGEHGYYGHHWGLHWELLHVPLIITGPGIPQGQRVADPVGLQQLFPTVLDLANGGNSPSQQLSLRCHWTLPASACDSNPRVLSEFSVDATEFEGNASISLVTTGWQFIRDAAGNRELYHLTSDPREEVNLASSPEWRSEAAALQQLLIAQVRASSPPWPGESYVWGLGESDFALLTRQVLGRPGSWPGTSTRRPSEQNIELLHSIPYQ
jgi:arylsulfatase A-like enzyme